MNKKQQFLNSNQIISAQNNQLPSAIKKPLSKPARNWQIGQVYNQVAHLYNAQRQQLRSGKYLHQLLQLLKPQSHILDLGCGAGVPVDDILIKKGHLITGIDISHQQIALARKNCPRGNYLVQDIEQLQMGEHSVEAVIAFYTIFHLPKEKHLPLLKTINSFLPKGGLMLITMGDRDFEAWHDFYGQQVWSSHYAPAKNSALVRQAGFEILLDEIDSSGREKHQVILGRKGA